MLRKYVWPVLLACLANPVLAEESNNAGQGLINQSRPGLLDMLQQADSNGDGAISKDEFMSQAEKRFNALDNNGDGKLSPDEFAAMRGRFKQIRENLRQGGRLP